MVIFNLFLIQIKQKNTFLTMGKKQYGITMTILPPRALLCDRTRQPLALNKDSFAAFLLPKKVRDKKNSCIS